MTLTLVLRKVMPSSPTEYLVLYLANVRQDHVLSQMIEMKKQGVTKPSPPNIQMPLPKMWCSHYHSLFLRDGLLVRPIGRRSSYPNYVIVVLISLREATLKAIHDNLFAGHLEIPRTEERLRKRFY